MGVFFYAGLGYKNSSPVLVRSYMKLIPDRIINLKQEFMSLIVKDPNGCWIWQGAIQNPGYGNFKGFLAHRVSHSIFKGSTDGFWVLHSCDNPPCVNPEHLRIGTPKENMADAWSRNRIKHKKGPDNPAAKLTHEQVKELGELYLSDKSINISELGRNFNISPSAAAHYLKLAKVESRKPFRVSAELEKRILELYDKDKTNMRLVAKELNIGLKGIVNVLKRNNIERKSYQIKPGHKNEMRWGQKTRGA